MIGLLGDFNIGVSADDIRSRRSWWETKEETKTKFYTVPTRCWVSKPPKFGVRSASALLSDLFHVTFARFGLTKKKRSRKAILPL